MCEVALIACASCKRVFKVKMIHCQPVKRLLGSTGPIRFEIRSSFNWSPLEGCSGLGIQPFIMFEPCNAHRSFAEPPANRSPRPTEATFSAMVNYLSALDENTSGVLTSQTTSLPSIPSLPPMPPLPSRPSIPARRDRSVDTIRSQIEYEPVPDPGEASDS